jgi:hypothetical protein
MISKYCNRLICNLIFRKKRHNYTTIWRYKLIMLFVYVIIIITIYVISNQPELVSRYK